MTTYNVPSGTFSFSRGYRDSKSGRFARRPVPDVDAESRFDPVGDDIPFDNVSGALSPSTIERPRYAPEADDLAQGGQRSPLRARDAALVSPVDAAHTIYGQQGAVLRTAARPFVGQWDDPTAYLVGLESHVTPATGIREVSDGD